MNDRKQEILDVAQDLLLLRGFSAFSYQDLSQRLGITKASIHHHFPAKEDLGVALCDRFIEQHAGIAAECEASGASPLEMFDKFIEQGNSLAKTGDRCCPGGVLQAEYNALPDKVRAKVNELFNVSHACLTEMLSRGRESGDFAFEGEPTDQAWLVMATLQGALLNSRVNGASIFDAVVRQLRASLLA